jgi:hypothetical protein
MQRTRIPPRHLAPQQRPRALARDHLLAESLLAMIAIALTTALVIGSMLDRSGSSTVARLPNLPPTPPTTAQAAAATPSPAPARVAGNLLGDPGFERGLRGWVTLGGAGLGRVEDARSGRWAASFAGGDGDPGMALREVTATAAGKAYAATVWVRATAPGVTVQLNVLEYHHGKRYAVDSGGAVLAGTGWERLEVAHDAHLPGDPLCVELLAPGLPGGASVLVDDLAVVTRKRSFMGMVAH